MGWRSLRNVSGLYFFQCINLYLRTGNDKNLCNGPYVFAFVFVCICLKFQGDGRLERLADAIQARLWAQPWRVAASFNEIAIRIFFSENDFADKD